MKRSLTRNWQTALCAVMLLISAVVPATARAQAPADLSAALTTRGEDVVRLLRGDPIEADVFTTNFLNAVPPEQFRALVRQITAQHGPPEQIISRQPLGSNGTSLRIRFAKAVASVNMEIEAANPHKIAGLVITGFEAAVGSISDVVAAIDALPGRNGLLVMRLDEEKRKPIAALDPDGRYAIASAVKLYILAELDRAVRAGERRWSDVVTLGPKSHPSGISQNWPDNAPMTLHTLTTLMISVSDNSATDTLIRVIGQKRLAAMVRASGHSQPDDLRPMLMTRQSSALKMPIVSDVRTRFLAAGPDERTRIVSAEDARLLLPSIDFQILTGQPNFIDQIGWFASPGDIVRLLAYLDREAGPEARAILAINPGIGPEAQRNWPYLGYKGGSEPGVMSMNFLLRSQSGQRYAIAAHWNNSAAPLAESEFVALVTRLVNLLAER